MGFRYGTAANALTKTIAATPNASGRFSATLSGLTESTTYYYALYAIVNGKTFTSEVASFTTLDKTVEPIVNQSWLELPAAMEEYDNLYVNTLYDGSSRNYTIAYDKSRYTTYWVAYALNSSHMGSYSRPDDWSYDPNLASSYQVDLRSASYSSYNNGAGHARGHLIPNASRNGNQAMQLQTFYVTNSVPQIPNSFNDGIWSALEGALQSIARSEEIYIVTGTALQTVGGSETISYTTAKNDTKQVPVPNYFYKVVLKVNKSGSTVTSAQAIGFWFENKAYSGTSYSSYAVSVDEIEQKTGLNFFVNLADNLENTAESNTSWTSFQSF